MNKSIEQKRIADLESIRTKENTHIVDAAINSGATAEVTALHIMKQRAEVDEMVDHIAKSANKFRK
ncbi:hypothetical protein PSTEL_13190 [Paenibacillus stellifer]|uniref:Uncharacterized protein n=1 Tax=Paenibacillus stellifer TaxID=169760 RepID=A0A089LUX8_9BACL|nr:hypothetical protein [Paenibacillus stellifer]AIQ63895.1 hypothetical protein PSTEL_13190 [Paenibacillus stellifer]